MRGQAAFCLRFQVVSNLIPTETTAVPDQFLIPNSKLLSPISYLLTLIS